MENKEIKPEDIWNDEKLKSVSKFIKKHKKMENRTQVKLGEIFECEGNLYTITTPTDPSNDTNLNDGRIIFEFVEDE